MSPRALTLFAVAAALVGSAIADCTISQPSQQCTGGAYVQSGSNYYQTTCGQGVASTSGTTSSVSDFAACLSACDSSSCSYAMYQESSGDCTLFSDSSSGLSIANGGDKMVAQSLGSSPPCTTSSTSTTTASSTTTDSSSTTTTDSTMTTLTTKATTASGKKVSTTSNTWAGYNATASLKWSNEVIYKFTETYAVPCETGWQTVTDVVDVPWCGCTETAVPTGPSWMTYTTVVPSAWGIGATVTVTVPYTAAASTKATMSPTGAYTAVNSFVGAASSVNTNGLGKVMIAVAGAVAGLAFYL